LRETTSGFCIGLGVKGEPPHNFLGFAMSFSVSPGKPRLRGFFGQAALARTRFQRSLLIYTRER
jgi:hypothetical protein